MAEFPALNLWTDAYLADTRHLTTAQHGAYLLLLMEAWRRPHCNLPDDDKILSRLTGMDTEEWCGAKEAVMAFWKYDGRSKTWTQKRLMFERDRAKVRSKSGRDNASSRWKKKKIPDAPALPNECGIPCENDATTTTILNPIIPLENDGSEKVVKVREYAFEGRAVKLNRKDFDKWKEIYHAIPDLRAELVGLDGWVMKMSEAKRRDWFEAVSRALNKKHQACMAENRQKEAEGQPKPYWKVLEEKRKMREEWEAKQAASGSQTQGGLI